MNSYLRQVFGLVSDFPDTFPRAKARSGNIVGSFMKLTAAGLFGIFTRFPFKRAMRTVLRCKCMKFFFFSQILSQNNIVTILVIYTILLSNNPIHPFYFTFPGFRAINSFHDLQVVAAAVGRDDS